MSRGYEIFSLGSGQRSQARDFLFLQERPGEQAEHDQHFDTDHGVKVSSILTVVSSSRSQRGGHCIRKTRGQSGEHRRMVRAVLQAKYKKARQMIL